MIFFYKTMTVQEEEEHYQVHKLVDDCAPKTIRETRILKADIMFF